MSAHNAVSSCATLAQMRSTPKVARRLVQADRHPLALNDDQQGRAAAYKASE